MTSNISLPMLDWTNENKHEAFSEWVDFMSSYFVIHNVEEKLKHNYILISPGPKGHEVIKNAPLTTEQKENSKNVFKVFETQMIQKPNKWVEREHWTSVSTLLGLISSVYRNIHHWRSNQRLQMFGGFSGSGNSIHNINSST